jgi:hypothetical protein
MLGKFSTGTAEFLQKRQKQKRGRPQQKLQIPNGEFFRCAALPP